MSAHSEIMRCRSYLSTALLRRETALRDLGQAIFDLWKDDPERFRVMFTVTHEEILPKFERVEAQNRAVRSASDVLARKESRF
jgi:hypothetical protein